MKIGLFGGASLGRLPSLSSMSALGGKRGPSLQDQIAAERASFREVHTGVVHARRALEQLQAAVRAPIVTPVTLETMSAMSTADLGLNIVPTQASITSEHEVNTTPTSFTPFGPSFAGSSSSLPTIGGVYDGSRGDDTFTFQVRRGGVVGVDSFRIRVFDGEANLIDSKLVPDGTPADIPISLSTGLTVSFSSGSLTKWDTFELSVSASSGSDLDPDKPLDGVRNDNPNLQPGVSVSSGTFDVNGTTIAVSPSDSVQDVLDRVTAQVADVTATYDAASDRVVLTRDTAGSHDIQLTGDDSGLLAALKLETAPLAPGLDDERAVAVADVAALSGIASGTLSVNGVDIAVNRDVDSLQDILSRIDESAASVSASYDAASGRVSVTSNTAGQTLALSDGTSGFFSAVGVSAETYEPEGGDTQAATLNARRARARVIERRLGEVRRRVGQVLSRLSAADVAQHQEGGVLRGMIDGGISAAFGGDAAADPSATSSRLRSGFGVDFDLSADPPDVFSFSSRGKNTFRAAFVKDPTDVLSFLDGSRSSGGVEPDDGKGLVPSLLDAFEAIDQRLRDRYGAIGVLFSAIA